MTAPLSGNGHVPAPPRNAPCPCGSGRRYKDCHGRLSDAAGLHGATLDQCLREALAAQTAGRLGEAVRLYRHALAIEPANFDALHMLGVARLVQQHADEAVELIGRALAVRPGVAVAMRNLELAQAALSRTVGTDAYATWRETRERAIHDERAAARAAIGTSASAPRLSIVLPTHETPAALLRACLDSVLDQTYPHWELCVADDASVAPHVGAILREYAARDSRIRVDFRATNGHISAASNSALALATAPFVALLDHDDVLPPAALAEVAIEIDAHPGAAVVYSDEDRIDEQGARFDPYFKPEWNPGLLTSQNYISHLGVYRTELVRAVGGFREGYEGAQDWDLVLRCTERVDSRAIRHIPQVLYHWRAAAGSTSRSMANKSYAAGAQERAVVGHFERLGHRVVISRVVGGNFLCADPLPGRSPTVSLIVLRTRGCAGVSGAEAWRTVMPDSVVDVRVVDLAAEGALAPDVDAAPLELAAGDAARINEAADGTGGEVLLFVGAAIDAPTHEAVATLAAHAALPEAGPVGAVIRDAFGLSGGGAYLVDPDRIAVPAFVGLSGGAGVMVTRDSLVQNVSAVRGDAMAIRRDLWRRLGGYDTASLVRRYHDVDLCLRSADAGARTLWHPGVVFTVGGAVRLDVGTTAGDADAATMRARWGARLAGDPAYHPELDRNPHRFLPRTDSRGRD